MSSLEVAPFLSSHDRTVVSILWLNIIECLKRTTKSWELEERNILRVFPADVYLARSLPRLIDQFAYFTANTSKVNNLRFYRRPYFYSKYFIAKTTLRRSLNNNSSLQNLKCWVGTKRSGRRKVEEGIVKVGWRYNIFENRTGLIYIVPWLRTSIIG